MPPKIKTVNATPTKKKPKRKDKNRNLPVLSKEPPVQMGKKPSGIKITLVLMTPRRGLKLLKRNVSNNRPWKPQHVDRLARLMKTGQWQDHQLIIVDNAGNLLDGQNRLRALIKANVCIWMRVARGFDPSVMATIDTNEEGRKAADILHHLGFLYAQQLPSIACLVRTLEGGVNIWSGGRSNLTAQEIVNICSKNKTSLTEAASWVIGSHPHLRNVYSSPMIPTACYAVFKKHFPNHVDDFFSRLNDALGGSEKGDPIALLLNALNRERVDSPLYKPATGRINGFASKAIRVILTYKAFSAFVRDTKLESRPFAKVVDGDMVPELPTPQEAAIREW